MQLKQFIPQEFCLSCDTCCRFLQSESIWIPLFTNPEIEFLVQEGLISKAIFAPTPAPTDNIGAGSEFRPSETSVGTHKEKTPCDLSRGVSTNESTRSNKKPIKRLVRLNLIKHLDYFICPCFNPTDHKCKIYTDRPFECQLYPFLLVKNEGKFYPSSQNEYEDNASADVTNEQAAKHLADNPAAFLQNARGGVHQGTTPACRNAALRPALPSGRRAGTGLPVGFHLALDKKCPYLNIVNRNELKAHIDYLEEELQKLDVLSFLKENKELFTEYPLCDLEILFDINI